MTWEEFKQEVDRQLEEMEVSGDHKIWYIDTSFPDKERYGGVCVGYDDNMGISIG